MATKDWTVVAEESVGGWGAPGQHGHETIASLSRRGNRWRCWVRCEWGSNQGYHEVHGSHETEGRGDTPEKAVEACRKDVFAWADSDLKRAEYATLLRKVVYLAEDNEHAEQTPIRLGDLGTGHVWFTSLGHPTGYDLIDQEESPVPDGWEDLLGSVEGNEWEWDGKGEVYDENANTVRRIVAFVPKES